jgi:hypothetical protein
VVAGAAAGEAETGSPSRKCCLGRGVEMPDGGSAKSYVELNG